MALTDLEEALIFEKIAEIESKIDKLLVIQKRVENKVDRLLSLSNQASQVGLLRTRR